jgi:hypothetical protein
MPARPRLAAFALLCSLSGFAWGRPENPETPPQAATTATISVQADKPGHAISPLLWGIFFEDINLAADGGLYPELVRNCSFEGSDGLCYWNFTSAAGSGAELSLAIDESLPLNAFNRRSLHVRSGGAGCVMENEGYWGTRFAASPTETTIHLAGATAISGQARSIVLTSEKPTDGNSLTVLRIPVAK